MGNLEELEAQFGGGCVAAYARGVYLLELLTGYAKKRAARSKPERLDCGYEVVGLDRSGPKRNSTAEALRLAAGAKTCCGKPMYGHGRGRWRCGGCGMVYNPLRLAPEELRQKLSRPRDERARRFIRKGGHR